jgi:capsular polysaccharide biosynthesis protein
LHHFHPTRDHATVVEGFDNVKTEVICASRENAEKIANRVLKEFFNDYPGVMWLETVEICRPERF